jgi:hypothetical protein
MGTKNYVVDDRCIVPPEIKMLSAAELAEKIAEYEQVLPPLKHNEAEIELPKTDVDWDSPFLVLDFMKYRGQIEKDSTAKDFMMAYCFEILIERMQDEADKKAILMRDVFFGENRDVMKNAPFMLERDTTLSWSKHLCQNAMPCDCTVITVTSVFNDGIDDAFLHEIMADSDVQVYHKIFSHLVPNVAKACHLSEKNAKYVSELQRGHVIIFADGKWTWSDVKADDEEYKMMTEYPSDIRVYGRDWQ